MVSTGGRDANLFDLMPVSSYDMEVNQQPKLDKKSMEMGEVIISELTKKKSDGNVPFKEERGSFPRISGSEHGGLH